MSWATQVSWAFYKGLGPARLVVDSFLHGDAAVDYGVAFFRDGCASFTSKYVFEYSIDNLRQGLTISLHILSDMRLLMFKNWQRCRQHYAYTHAAQCQLIRPAHGYQIQIHMQCRSYFVNTLYQSLLFEHITEPQVPGRICIR